MEELKEYCVHVLRDHRDKVYRANTPPEVLNNPRRTPAFPSLLDFGCGAAQKDFFERPIHGRRFFQNKPKLT